MHIDNFNFNLPSELIATHPAEPRDSSRLLHVSKQLTDKQFADLPNLLKPNDLLVFNNSKVIPARLFVKKGDSKIEILLHKLVKAESANTQIWEVFAKPAKKLKINDIVELGPGFAAIVQDKLPTGNVVLQLQAEQVVEQAINKYGAMPLPSYIKRDASSNDDTTYQTIYAKNAGSVAAPTAGLHFTDRVFKKLAEQRVNTTFLTLHVGAGTFQPVKTEDINNHTLHSEYIEVNQANVDAINKAKQAGGRIIAVGTTSLRSLESAAKAKGNIQQYTGETDIFIKPGYEFKIIDGLLTNFHLPKSSLFILIAALAGLDKVQAAYAHAIKNKYRFYSYGDCCLFL